jgi:hypothetical protein
MSLAHLMRRPRLLISVTQAKAEYRGNSLYGRGHQGEILQICWRYQHVNIANARATVQTDDRQNQRFVPSLVLAVSALLPMFDSSGPIVHQFAVHLTHWDGRGWERERIAARNFRPVVLRLNGPS